MSRFTSLVWRRRYAVLALTLGAMLVGVLADILANHPPAYLDLQATVTAFILSYLPAQIGNDIIANIRKKSQHGAKWVIIATIGVITVAIGHAVQTFIPGLLVATLAGFSLLPDIFVGLAFTLQQALLPSLVVGVVMGIVSGLCNPQ